MKPLIRPFTPDDYPAFAAVESAAYSDTQGQPLIPILEEEIRAEDAERDPTLRFGRWVAEVAGQVVGGAEHNQNAGRYHPHKFLADVFVQPRYQGQGIGTALHQHIMEALRPYDPLSAQGATREDLVSAVAFLERRGWQEALRMWESFLDVTTWDPTPFNGVEEAVRAQGMPSRRCRSWRTIRAEITSSTTWSGRSGRIFRALMRQPGKASRNLLSSGLTTSS